MEVYFYMPAEEAEAAVECGISLENYYTRKTKIRGHEEKCIVALLNPKDDQEKYRSKDHVCLRIEADPRYAYVADRSVYDAGLENSELRAAYEKSVMPLAEYIFGAFRLPECLIISTVIPGKVRISGKLLDTPLLYDNSEDFYIDCLYQKFREDDPAFTEKALYHYMVAKSLEGGRYVRTDDPENGMAIFTDREDGRLIPLRIPQE